MLTHDSEQSQKPEFQRCPQADGASSAWKDKLLKKQAVLGQRQEEFTGMRGQRGLRVAGLL